MVGSSGRKNTWYKTVNSPESTSINSNSLKYYTNKALNYHLLLQVVQNYVYEPLIRPRFSSKHFTSPWSIKPHEHSVSQQRKDQSYPYFGDDQTKAQGVMCLMQGNAAKKVKQAVERTQL